LKQEARAVPRRGEGRSRIVHGGRSEDKEGARKHAGERRELTDLLNASNKQVAVREGGELLETTLFDLFLINSSTMASLTMYALRRLSQIHRLTISPPYTATRFPVSLPHSSPAPTSPSH
jgi:hypothetical protein